MKVPAVDISSHVVSVAVIAAVSKATFIAGVVHYGYDNDDAD